MNMEKSIFEKEPTKAKNKLGEKTRIEDPDVAQEYYNNALKITTKEGGSPGQSKEMGENLTEKDYEDFDDVLKTIRENKFVEKLDIQWDNLSREELMEMHLEAEKILAGFDEFLIKRLEPTAAMLKLSLVVLVTLLVWVASFPGMMEKLDNLSDANGEIVSVSKKLPAFIPF